MVFFVITNSWYHANVTEQNTSRTPTISAAPVEQIVFRDSYSTLKSLFDSTSKIQFYKNEFSGALPDLPSLEIATCQAFLITKTLYNTFYTNVTIHAP
jgi:hypothetical protein